MQCISPWIYGICDGYCYSSEIYPGLVASRVEKGSRDRRITFGVGLSLRLVLRGLYSDCLVVLLAYLEYLVNVVSLHVIFRGLALGLLVCVDITQISS